MRICVFCGSSNGNGTRYTELAEHLGHVLAERGIGLVYGGASVGTMGVVADAALAAGGEVIGVIPSALFNREVAHRGLTQLHEVANMHQRKALMADLSDGFLALPGGAGTLEELFEVWTWALLGLHTKPIGLVDGYGYYQQLLAFVEHMVNEGFLARNHREMISVDADPARLVNRFAALLDGATSTGASVPTVDVLAWVHVVDGRQLHVRTKGKEAFYLPGGKREPGESDAAALCREVREELGVELNPGSLSLFDVVEDAAHGFTDGRRMRMVCYTARCIGEPTPDGEIAELAWIGSEGIEGVAAARFAPAGRRVLRTLLERGLLR